MTQPHQFLNISFLFQITFHCLFLKVSYFLPILFNPLLISSKTIFYILYTCNSSEAFTGLPVRFIVSTAFFCSLCLFSRFYYLSKKNCAHFTVDLLRPGLRVHLPEEPIVCFLKAPWSITNQEGLHTKFFWLGVYRLYWFYDLGLKMPMVTNPQKFCPLSKASQISFFVTFFYGEDFPYCFHENVALPAS